MWSLDGRQPWKGGGLGMELGAPVWDAGRGAGAGVLQEAGGRGGGEVVILRMGPRDDGRARPTVMLPEDRRAWVTGGRGHQSQMLALEGKSWLVGR